MNLKLKALIQTAGIVGVASLTGVAITMLLKYLSFATVTNVIGVGVLIGLTYLMYTIILSQLEMRERFNNVDK